MRIRAGIAVALAQLALAQSPQPSLEAAPVKPSSTEDQRGRVEVFGRTKLRAVFDSLGLQRRPLPESQARAAARRRAA